MWSLAQAKQQFSEVVRLAESRSPQQIMRHHKEVAVLINANEYQRFKVWRDAQAAGSNAGQNLLSGMAEIRSLLLAYDPNYQGIELPSRADRASAVDAMLDAHYPHGENADGSPRPSH